MWYLLWYVFWAAVLVIVSSLAYLQYLAWLSFRDIPKDMPIATGRVPFFNHLFTVLPHLDDIHDYYVELHLKYGPTAWAINESPLTPTLVTIVDPTNLEYVLSKNFYNYEKGPTFQEAFEEILGEGIFNADGAIWRRQRKIASHMFKVLNMRSTMLPTFVAEGRHLVSILEQHAAKKNDVFDLQNLYFGFTFDSIAKIAFGVDFPKEAGFKFAQAFDRAQRLVIFRFFDPFWKIFRLFNVFHEKAFAHNVRIIDGFSYQLISTRKQQKDWTDRDDLLSRAFQYRDENNTQLSDKQVRDIVLNFLIAGRDTTANLLSWATYMMTQHPEKAAKVIAEIQSVVEAANGDPFLVDYDQLVSLQYLEAFFLETLRLYPSVPTDVKVAVSDDTLPDGTKIPKGVFIRFPNYTYGRMESLWGKDALQFRPERWLDMQQMPSAFHYPAFNAGPRTCLGKAMALVEARSAFVSIYGSGFRFKLADSSIDSKYASYKPKYQQTVTMPMKAPGLLVVVTKE